MDIPAGDSAALQEADAKLAQIEELLNCMQVLAQQAARENCAPARRARLQQELAWLRNKIDRIADTLQG